MVTSNEGRFRVSAHPFTLARPQGAIERLRTGLWKESGPRYTGGCITTATVTDVNEEGFEVWACAETKISRWTVLHQGWEQVLYLCLSGHSVLSLIKTRSLRPRRI